MKKFYLFVFIFIFVGCNKTTTVLNNFSHTVEQAKAIEFTKKSNILYENRVNTMFFASYLNKIDEKYVSDNLDSFIIGFFRVNKENHEISKNGYILTLNGLKPSSMLELDSKSDLIKAISLRNPWAKYYLVKFDSKSEIRKLKLKLSHPLFGKTEIDFKK